MTTLARWSHRRRHAVVGGWILLLVALAVAVLTQGAAFTDKAALPDSESASAYALLAEMGAGASADGSTQNGTIVWHTTGLAIDDPAVQDQVRSMLTDVAGLPGVEQVVSPYDPAGARQVNPEVSTAYATVTVDDGIDVDQVRATADTLAGAGLEVAIGGQAFSELPGASHGTEGIGIIAALVILFLVFRSRWAAFLPILVGVVGVGTSLLAVMVGSHWVDLADTSLTMGALIGLGVGIDYALFIVNRHRKALMAGASVEDAITTAIGTSGRAVIFAGLTVIVALLGMVVVGLGVLTGMGQAAAVTVLFTVLAAITLLPALLGMLGHKVLSRAQHDALAAGRPGSATPTGRAPLSARWALLVQRAPAAPHSPRCC
ncbi:MMPL family transporter [Cellulomonas soli]